MQGIRRWLGSLPLVLVALSACGGGGGGGAPVAAAVPDASLVGEYELVGFDVYFYDTGAHYTQGDFASFSGSLRLDADGSGYASVCVESTCLDGPLTWGTDGQRFYADGESVPLQFDGSMLVLDYDRPSDGFREIKHYVRRSGVAAANVAGGDEASPPVDPLRMARAVLP